MGKNLQDKVEKFFNDGIIADAHCDTLLDLAEGKRNFRKKSTKGHLDLPRMHEGKVDIQFFAAFIGSEFKPERSLKRTLQLIDVFYREVLSTQQDIVLGLSYRQIKRELEKEIRTIAILTIEGGEALCGELSVLRMLYRLGVRSIGLTWNQRNEIADGVWEKDSGGGLTNFGRQVIEEMNNLGMMIDLAHISEAGFWDVIEISSDPVMVSHANCKKLCDHPRNLTDEQIKEIANKNGIVGLTFAPEFLGGEADLETFLNHVDHIAGLVGVQCIAIGSDFDGIEKPPVGLADVTKMPSLIVGLLQRGYTIKETQDIMGFNLLRFIKKIL